MGHQNEISLYPGLSIFATSRDRFSLIILPDQSAGSKLESMVDQLLESRDWQFIKSLLSTHQHLHPWRCPQGKCARRRMCLYA